MVGSHYANRLVYVFFVLRITALPRVKFFDSKRSLNPLVVYATDRSKVEVTVLFLFFVALWLILRGASCLSLPYSLSSCFFSPFSICLFIFFSPFSIYFVRTIFFSFYSSSWCQGFAAVCDCGTPWTFLLTFFTCFKHNNKV